MTATADMTDLGIVVIGRNEGERLRRCLASARGRGLPVVYVDSGSTDGSCDLARSMSAEVVTLDLSIPFTAARARNTGAGRLIELHPDIAFIQFIDGDCEIQPGWLEVAHDALAQHPDRAIVLGRLRERHPERTLYNRLADLEWQQLQPGETHSCGGIAMHRLRAFLEAGRFDPSIIAGEEPELALRVRRLGWKIVVIDAEMALHDLDMHHFSQWWRRAKRAGHAYAEGFRRHGRAPERFRRRKLRSILLWGLVLPLLALALAWPTCGLSLLALTALFLLQIARTVRGARRRVPTFRDALLCGITDHLSNIPQAVGVLEYLWNRCRGRGQRIIEYKTNPRNP